MQIHPNSYWKFRPGNTVHKVISFDHSEHAPTEGLWTWIITWSVQNPSPNPGGIDLPLDDSRCWSWYGPAEEFLKQFKPL